MQLRGVTVTGSRVRVLMGADVALGRWLFLPGAVVYSAGHWIMPIDMTKEHVLLVLAFSETSYGGQDGLRCKE